MEDERAVNFALQCDVVQFYDVIALSFKALAKARLYEDTTRLHECTGEWENFMTELVQCINLVFEADGEPCQLAPFHFAPATFPSYFNPVCKFLFS